jgi:hypothetical protein
LVAVHYEKLSVGAKVFVRLLNNPLADGEILTESDFARKGFSGWTEEHEPKIKQKS